MAQRESAPAPWQMWTMVALVFLGAVVVGLGLVIDSWWVFGAGWALAAVGLLFGFAIRAMEFTEEDQIGESARVEPGTTPRHG